MASRSRQHLSGNLGMAGSGPENLFARRDGSQKGGTRRHAPLLRGMKWRKSGFTRLSAGGGSLERTRLWSPNSLLAGKIQGISFISGSGHINGKQKEELNQALTDQFPTHRNREFLRPLQGIKAGDQGNFHRDQGIPLSPAVLRGIFCRCRKSNPPGMPSSPSPGTKPRLAKSNATTRAFGRCLSLSK